MSEILGMIFGPVVEDQDSGQQLVRAGICFHKRRASDVLD